MGFFGFTGLIEFIRFIGLIGFAGFSGGFTRLWSLGFREGLGCVWGLEDPKP